MVEIIALALLAAGCAGAFLTARVCVRMLGTLERLESAVSALGAHAATAGAGVENAGQAREQERYEQGVANILAYGTREMLRRRGEAQ